MGHNNNAYECLRLFRQCAYTLGVVDQPPKAMSLSEEEALHVCQGMLTVVWNKMAVLLLTSCKSELRQ
eukprot:7622460-Pyramimonas_sp.AAC.1